MRGRERRPRRYAKQNAVYYSISHQVLWTAMHACIAFEKLNLIGFIAGSDRCTRLRRCSGSARINLAISARDG